MVSPHNEQAIVGARYPDIYRTVDNGFFQTIYKSKCGNNRNTVRLGKSMDMK